MSASDQLSDRQLFEAVLAELAALRAEIASLRTADATVLKVEQAAERLGVGRTRIFALLKSGKLRSVKKYGRTRMVTRASIEAFLAGPTARAQKTPPPQKSPKSPRALGDAVRAIPI